MTTSKFVSKIQSGNLENIYREVTQIAAEWTVCGFIDEANKLLENLWSYHLPHERDTWITDQGFQFFWNLSNKYPKNIPFKLGDLDKMEENNWESVFIPNFITNDNIDVPLESLTGKNLLYKALILANPSVDRKGKATEKNYKKALKALEKFISEKPEGYDLFHALTFASILCARNNMSSKALTYLVQWAQEYKKNIGRNFILEYLMRDTATAKLLLTKPMAPVFALNEEKCKTDLIEISEALQKRIQDGHKLVYENLEWKELLQKISLNAISLNDLEFSTDIKKSKWLGFEPATSSNIEATEKRLNISLPNEYKQFLQTTNGFNAYTITGMNIHPIEKIDFLKNLDPGIYETLLKENEGMVNVLEKTLLIGGLHEDIQLLLVPFKEKKTWECWVFAYWMTNEMKFENFRFYMENELFQLEQESFSKG